MVLNTTKAQFLAATPAVLYEFVLAHRAGHVPAAGLVLDPLALADLFPAAAAAGRAGELEELPGAWAGEREIGRGEREVRGVIDHLSVLLWGRSEMSLWRKKFFPKITKSSAITKYLICLIEPVWRLAGAPFAASLAVALILPLVLAFLSPKLLALQSWPLSHRADSNISHCKIE